MKVAIVIPSDINSAPYLQYYADVLKRKEIPYHFISWNRKGSNDSLQCENNIVYTLESAETMPLYRKYIDYLRFSVFVRKELESGNYEFVIVHTIQASLFLGKYLKKHFNNRYIIDIRDYSKLLTIYKNRFHQYLKCSALNCVSSPGFLSWLPGDTEFIVSHNLRSDSVCSDYKYVPFDKNNIRILTIGQLRDYSTNSRIIDAFGDKSAVLLLFAGNGNAKESLEELVLQRKYRNVLFTGRYKKEEENGIVKEADFINILLPTGVHDVNIMSNRFYLAVIHRKPMIVNKESIQARYVEKYRLGVVVKEQDNISEKLMQYIDLFDADIFNEGCDLITKEISSEILLFEKKVESCFS
ncbi:MAG: hypothetical protein H6Q12_1201 [Bacteroidetes bacterium]|nr:hypothetical protein [Bacteroidota bacterium]